MFEIGFLWKTRIEYRVTEPVRQTRVTGRDTHTGREGGLSVGGQKERDRISDLLSGLSLVLNKAGL